MSMSGSAGFSGGFLPVLTCQDLSIALRAAAAPPSDAASEKIDHTLELSLAMARPYRVASGRAAVR
jgi:hypothetical protein